MYDSEADDMVDSSLQRSLLVIPDQVLHCIEDVDLELALLEPDEAKFGKQQQEADEPQCSNASDQQSYVTFISGDLTESQKREIVDAILHTRDMVRGKMNRLGLSLCEIVSDGYIHASQSICGQVKEFKECLDNLAIEVPKLLLSEHTDNQTERSVITTNHQDIHCSLQNLQRLIKEIELNFVTSNYVANEESPEELKQNELLKSLEDLRATLLNSSTLNANVERASCSVVTGEELVLVINNEISNLFSNITISKPNEQ